MELDGLRKTLRQMLDRQVWFNDEDFRKGLKQCGFNMLVVYEIGKEPLIIIKHAKPHHTPNALLPSPDAGSSSTI